MSEQNLQNIETRLKSCDSVIQSVVSQFISRSEVGRLKYGATLDRQDLSRVQWIQHAIEEAMDMINYLVRLKMDLEKLEIEENEIVNLNREYN